MNTPDPPYWTLNLCIGAFCSVSVHFWLFHCFMKLGAKRAELEQLMQKFVPWSCIRIFCSEPTRSTPLDPELMFWRILYCLGTFWLFRYCAKLDTKSAEMVELMHKFVAWSRFGIFRNERTRSSQSDPKLLFLCVSKCLGAFGNVSLLHETWCRIGWTGTINAQVCAMKSPWIFFATNTLDPPNWTLNSCFGAFGNVSILHGSRCKMGWTGAINAQVCAMKLHWNFSQWTHPIHPIRP